MNTYMLLEFYFSIYSNVWCARITDDMIYHVEVSRHKGDSISLEGGYEHPRRGVDWVSTV